MKNKSIIFQKAQRATWKGSKSGSLANPDIYFTHAKWFQWNPHWL